MIDVLIADDSPTSLSYIKELLSIDEEFRIVAQAKNGIDAVRLAQETRPNVIVMDLFMPGLDGFEATQEIMRTTPTPIIIVSASARVNDIDVSMKALKAGALTILGKPKLSVRMSLEETAQGFIQIVKAMANVKVIRHYMQLPPVQASTQDSGRHQPLKPGAEEPARINLTSARHRALTSDVMEACSSAVQFQPNYSNPEDFKPLVVALLTSTGGPLALATILSQLPKDFHLPVLIVQHISPGFISGYVDWLGKNSTIPVKIAEHGEPLRAGTVYFAPDDFHLGMDVGRNISLSNAPSIRGFRPSGNHLFESVSNSCNGQVLGVVLTGMGNDGVDCLNGFRKLGGKVIAQDEQSCTVYGIPRAAVEANCVDKVVSLQDIAKEIVEMCRK